jgi:hypothetical protein
VLKSLQRLQAPNTSTKEKQVDPATLSALAAFAAAATAATVAGIQFYIGRTQARAALTSAQAALMNAQNAGIHTVAGFRQKWIDKVIDTLCDHQSILAVTPVGGKPGIEDDKKLAASRAKLEILLNPGEEDTVELLKAMDAVDKSSTDSEFAQRSSEMTTIARRLLKREWDRIKTELK